MQILLKLNSEGQQILQILQQKMIKYHLFEIKK